MSKNTKEKNAAEINEIDVHVELNLLMELKNLLKPATEVTAAGILSNSTKHFSR